MKVWLAAAVAIWALSCAPKFSFNLKGLEIPMDLISDQTLKDLTSIAVSILTEDNFVVVHANADVGLVTTEWGGLHLGHSADARIRFTINILRDLKIIKIRPSVEYRGMMGDFVDANGQPISKKHQEAINNYLTSVSERLYTRFSKRINPT